ncbi:MAG TPA: isocitrate/isopropylmalate family dehydrogenase [Candidatus Binatia bacterium]|nr:isocitrate/isopropylmalate family dehydrogenase [Candidatus Binatia bacterium]
MQGASTAGRATPLTQCIPGWERRASDPRLIGVIPGEGIGPEVIEAALAVLAAVTQATGSQIDVRRLEPDNPDRGGCPPLNYADFCDTIFAANGAVMSGPMGGRSVYDLRARFDLYCKLVPLRPSASLDDVAIVRPDRLREVDVLIVRENVGGLYFGESGRREDGRLAHHHFSYHADQVTRIVDVAAKLARGRRGRLSVVIKPGGLPDVSALWREVAEAVARDGGITLELLEVDNAAFQLVADPRRFDVVAAPNLFGDILADAATVLLGSRGMSYSGNFGPDRRAVYQTGHGAAHDLAGSDRANPIAQILSLAMMLRESLDLTREAWAIETAVEHVVASPVRSQDIAGPESVVVGTRALGECIAAAAVRSLEQRTAAA